MKELTGNGVPLTVACRVLKLARQPYYRWLDQPVTDAMLEEAYRANALFDAHRDDPEFGYRFLADEARSAGAVMADRTAGDNAVMDSFFSLLQKSVLDRRSWATREELWIAIVSWMERTYHRRRRQASLGRLTPVEFETVMTTSALRAA